MEITIKGEPKEIAAMLLEVAQRQSTPKLHNEPADAIVANEEDLNEEDLDNLAQKLSESLRDADIDGNLLILIH